MDNSKNMWFWQFARNDPAARERERDGSIEIPGREEANAKLQRRQDAVKNVELAGDGLGGIQFAALTFSPFHHLPFSPFHLLPFSPSPLFTLSPIEILSDFFRKLW